jgi:hypothetical protein
MADEHTRVLASENLEDYRQYVRLLWETGGSQTDIPNLTEEDIDWPNERIYYSRRKLAFACGFFQQVHRSSNNPNPTGILKLPSNESGTEDGGDDWHSTLLLSANLPKIFTISLHLLT